MDQTQYHHPLRRLLLRLHERFKPTKNKSIALVRRRKALLSLLTRHLRSINILLFLVGYLWMLSLPLSYLSRGTYIDENALQPSQVNTYWNWGDVHTADRYLEHLERLRDMNATSDQRAEFFLSEFQKLGILSYIQKYRFSASGMDGTNVYASLASPRGPGTEAMIISASWLSRTGEGDGTLNLRGVSTVLALANFLKGYSLWAKDIIFVVSDGYLDGMHAWLNSYHDVSQSNLIRDNLMISSGVIWTALNIDYPGHSFSHLGVYFEGLNGRLPNQDLINCFSRISRFTGGVPVVLYDHVDSAKLYTKVASWVPSVILNHVDLKSYFSRLQNIFRHFSYQVQGRPSGVHGLFHRFRIDAFTVYAFPASGPHGFHAIGRIVESTLRTMNNLLERLHASFFFYMLTDHDQFMKIGSYLPSAIFISVALMVQGLQVWVSASYLRRKIMTSEKAVSTKENWLKRKRPVTPILAIVLGTYAVGGLLFLSMETSLSYSNNEKTLPYIALLFACLPLSLLAIPPYPEDDVAPLSSVLKAFNLCLASTVISIIVILNFSLAALLSLSLGITLPFSSSSMSIPMRLLKYIGYIILALSWVLWGSQLTTTAFWDWEILGGWFAPFVCIVYVPLVLQAGIVCLLPP
ncbi:Gaa1-like protein [Cyathus striatus]|nr:Gaa1-like protein [Cyathus striatus]